MGDEPQRKGMVAQLGRFLSFFAYFWLILAVGAWLVVILRGAHPFWLICASLASLLGGMWPHWVQLWRESAETTQRLQRLRPVLNTLLQERCDEKWTLIYANTQSAEPPPCDALLVGPDQLYPLVFLAPQGTFRCEAAQWWHKPEGGTWQRWPGNPHQQILPALAEWQTALTEQGLHSPVLHPRLVWGGEGLLIAENPTPPIWWLDQPDSVQLPRLLFGEQEHSADLARLLTQLGHSPKAR